MTARADFDVGRFPGSRANRPRHPACQEALRAFAADSRMVRSSSQPITPAPAHGALSMSSGRHHARIRGVEGLLAASKRKASRKTEIFGLIERP